MPNQRHDDNRLVEIEAALELLRQVKEDTFDLILNLQEAVAHRGRCRNRAEPETVDLGWRRKPTRAV